MEPTEINPVPPPDETPLEPAVAPPAVSENEANPPAAVQNEANPPAAVQNEPIPPAAGDSENEAIVEPEPEPEPEPMTAEQLIAVTGQPVPGGDEVQLKAVLEAVIYVTDEPLALAQIAGALQLPVEAVKPVLDSLIEDYNRADRGLIIREVAGGYKMGTKPEHHEAVRTFAKNLKPPLKLSLAALETLAVIAYKQPITAPEIMEIRGVQGAGVLKTLLDRKLITTAGRKNVIGKPILYKTTKEFLLQFGLKDLAELPTLKEFEELRRLALTDAEEAASDLPAGAQPVVEAVDEAALSAAAASIGDAPPPPPEPSVDPEPEPQPDPPALPGEPKAE